VAGAQLPGILQDKKGAWTKGVQDLQRTVEAYEAAAVAKDSVKLLDQAEELHSQYEGLVRTIRPPMKEIAAFHAELYMLYHHYGPAFDLPNITTTAAAMKEKMTALNAAALPSRYASRQDVFASARSKLSTAMDKLQDAVKTGKKETITAAIESVHYNYVALEKVFE
jgi:NADH dehydrogenase/NADH:ubiquinone oxidoreductase subunit G